MKEETTRPPDPIAVIGIGCRFPGNVTTAHAFWHLLLMGQDAVSEVPQARWDLGQYYHPDPAQPGKTYQRHGGFLEEIDHFDASFFGISAVEASRMDPQQRLLLEVSYEALEDAGLPLECVAGSQTGVFLGICTAEYGEKQRQDPLAANPYTNAGGAASIAANRLSYCFDWHGPSLSVDTACSSALVAVHLACQSTWKQECMQALAGGVSLLIDPVTSIGFIDTPQAKARGILSSSRRLAEGDRSPPVAATCPKAFCTSREMYPFLCAPQCGTMP